ncbi:uncharacterized protein LOC116201541 [Punica granatum]|uniref:Uncharacterized protein n=2 Tax=Punica granatum TaxID=22663 RepID=A0A2I0JLK8_PUNGR|nr:uncharacterized protein LOC116201541 [Punica granatum]PKI57174.1 hypothetical protein CRG98_022464 [Punica granatum]
MEILHFSHEHPLVLDRIENGSEMCNLCSKTIHRLAFACSDCGFLLHKSCAKLPREMGSHPLHPQHPLVLVPSHPDSSEPFKCSLCEKTCSGFVFRCSNCDYSVGVDCFLRTQPYPDLPSRQKTRKIHHLSHQHGLLLRYYGEKNSMRQSCRGCEMPASGPTYYCPECPQFALHKSCSESPQQIQHPFHPLHPLILHTKSPYPSENLYCDACRKTIRNGFAFHCSNCKFDLDVACISRMPTLRHKKHDQHPLAFFEDMGVEVTCNVCGKKCREYIYRCTACNFNAHCTCLPFASTVKHKKHQHSLFLKDSVVKGDSGWFPCEVCKKRITPKHRVYYCEDCSYGVHIECVDSEDHLDPHMAKMLEDFTKVQAEADALAVELKLEEQAISAKLQNFFGKYSSMLNKQSELKEKLKKGI